VVEAGAGPLRGPCAVYGEAVFEEGETDLGGGGGHTTHGADASRCQFAVNADGGGAGDSSRGREYHEIAMGTVVAVAATRASRGGVLFATLDTEAPSK
jgi:hypothetical protein